MKIRELGYSDAVALLVKAEIFSRLLPDDLYWLASRSSLACYESGEPVFVSGEKAERFYIIRSGSITVSRELKNGETESMAHFVAGDVLGDFDFARRAAYDANAHAAESVELLVFPGFSHTNESLAGERPDVSARLLLRSVSMISSRIRSTQQLISENAPWVRELRKQMYTDTATGLWNKGFLDEELTRKLIRVAPVLLIYIKPDKFKDLCDTWGHGAGDLAMLHIAEILKSIASDYSGWAIRLKSNETALVLPKCPAEAHLTILRRIRDSIAAIRLQDKEVCAGPETAALEGCAGMDRSIGDFRFTTSMCFSIWPADDSLLKNLLEKTYATLLTAWRDGGNRVYRIGKDFPEGGIS